MSTIEEIRESIQAQLRALDEQRGPLEQALQALEASNGTTLTPKSPPASASVADTSDTAPATRSRRSNRRSRYSDDAILDVVRANGPNVPARVIRDHLGGTSNQLSMRLRKLVDDNLLQRQGERRASVYTAA